MGVNRLWLYTSLTVVPFYEVEGWQMVEPAKRGILDVLRLN